jgi:serine/threonine protein phosphatase PrpC
VLAAPLIDWGFATAMRTGETESGDLHVVRPVGSDVLVAVVDGLGHGAGAAAAARTAVAVVSRHAGDPLPRLLQRCHEALVGSRGVVMSLARFDRAAATMTWLGVGNVEGVLLYADPGSRPARATLLTRGGIVGSELPPLRAEVVSVAPGDALILATDGVATPFAADLLGDASPQDRAERILARHGKGTDDALVLVARYVGGAGGGP